MEAAREFIEANSIPEPNTGCWFWMKAIGKPGYGVAWFQGFCYGAHRLSFAAFKEPIPPGANVLHACDNRACVNPRHLHVGSRTDNMREMRERGRAGDLYGEEQSGAKLTAEQVAHIRARLTAGEKQADLVREYGMASSTISRISTKKLWRFAPEKQEKT